MLNIRLTIKKELNGGKQHCQQTAVVYWKERNNKTKKKKKYPVLSN